MEQIWFEMPDIRRRKLEQAVWIPLREINQITEEGKFGYLGYKEEFFGVGSLAVYQEKINEAEKLDWSSVGISYSHRSYVENGVYIPSDVFENGKGHIGLNLVLDQELNSIEHNVWHLHQDLVIALELLREGDIWIRPDEGYIEVAKLYRKEDGTPFKLEIRASHLKDYLCARNMVLYVNSYRHRIEVCDTKSHINWEEDPKREIKDGDRWEGSTAEIHEGGMLYGSTMAVIHDGRTDVDFEEDVPTFGFPSDDNIEHKSWESGYSGRKLYRIEGELWRSEWIHPASISRIICRDSLPPTIFFIVDIEGNQENKETLIKGSRWLWFNPGIINALLQKRGGFLRWHTMDTGDVGCSPDYSIHFGVNAIGLITAYAKDIAQLPEWQQKIWAGYNVSPEGKVSIELLMSQMKATPANTQAPEVFLADLLNGLNKLSEKKLNIRLFSQSDKVIELIPNIHRFRSLDRDSFFGLAKDLARITADNVIISELKKIVGQENLGSLKQLEKLLSKRIHSDKAREIMGPFFGIYDLRLGDAHLKEGDFDEALTLVGVDKNAPYVIQGFQLILACVSCLYDIGSVINL